MLELRVRIPLRPTASMPRCRDAGPQCQTRGCTRRIGAPRRHLKALLKALERVTGRAFGHRRRRDIHAKSIAKLARDRLKHAKALEFRASKMAHSLHKESGNLRPALVFGGLSPELCGFHGRDPHLVVAWGVEDASELGL